MKIFTLHDVAYKTVPEQEQYGRCEGCIFDDIDGCELKNSKFTRNEHNVQIKTMLDECTDNHIIFEEYYGTLPKSALIGKTWTFDQIFQALYILECYREKSVILNALKRAADPEYAEYLRLKGKFE